MILVMLVAIFFWFMAFKGVIWLLSGDETFWQRAHLLVVTCLVLYIVVCCTFGLQYLFDDAKQAYGQFILAYAVVSILLVKAEASIKARFGDVSTLWRNLFFYGYLTIPFVWAWVSGFAQLSWPYLKMIPQFLFLPVTELLG